MRKGGQNDGRSEGTQHPKKPTKNKKQPPPKKEPREKKTRRRKDNKKKKIRPHKRTIILIRDWQYETKKRGLPRVK